MLAAQELQMVNGDYAFLRIELYPEPGYEKPWTPLLIGEGSEAEGVTVGNEDELQGVLKDAYEAMMLFTHR